MNLNGGDRGVALLRQVLRENIRARAAGGDYMAPDSGRGRR